MDFNITSALYKIDSEMIEVTEQQTTIIYLKIKDDSGILYTPTVLRWQLTDSEGVIKNNRSFSVVQTTLDKIVLQYADTTIVTDNNGNVFDKLYLSIAAGLEINSVKIQQNFEVMIKLKNLKSNFPNLFEVVVNPGLDTPFSSSELDTPFTDLDQPFS